MARHQPAHPQQQERGKRRQHRKPVQRTIDVGFSHFNDGYGATPLNYLVWNAKFTFASLSVTVTDSVFSPSFRCAATTVYVPLGTFLMVNFPSVPLTAYHGL